MKLIFTLVLLVFIVNTSVAEIYKTIDEKGRVVFTQFPPTKDAQEYKIKGVNNTANSSATSNTVSPSSFEKQKKYLDYLTRERLDRKEKYELKKQEKAELRTKCLRMKADLQDLDQGGINYYELDDQGNRVDVEREKIENRKNRIRDFLKRNCSHV